MISCAAARLAATNTPLPPGGNVEMADVRLSAGSHHLSPARRITLISRLKRHSAGLRHPPVMNGSS